MPDDRFEKVQQLFLQALEVSCDDRTVWLQQQCGDDADTRKEVLELLSANDRQDDPLEEGVLPQAEITALSAGPTIPGYRFIRRLAVGGQAVVYEAIQLSTEQVVAVKLLRMGAFSTPDEEARFAREATALAKIQHPHIVPIIDRGRTDSGISYLVMQFIAGWPIDKYVDLRLRACEKSSVDHPKLLSLFIKIAMAVDVAHQRGIVHRDLKPSNILVDEHEEPRLLDFGLAKSLGGGDEDTVSREVTITGGFLGSLPWASPEQAGGEASRTDHRTDVYSLGVILYQMLTGGQFPYQVVGNMRDVLNNILNAAPTPPSLALRQFEVPPQPGPTSAPPVRRVASSIDPTLEAIVLKALEKSPECRQQSARELADDILAYLRGRPRDDETAKPAAMAGQRRPVRKIAAGLICGLLVVLAATWCLSVWRRRPPAPGSSPKFSSPAVRDGLSQDPLVADRASSRVDDGDAMTSANQVEESAHSAVLAVAAEESDVLQRMAEHFDAGEFQAAMQVYRGWPASDREHGRLHEEAAQLVFQKAMELFETETAAAQPDFDVVQQLLLTLIESNANAVANESETVAADCADARVVLAYLKTMPPRGSTEDINSLQQSVDYLDLYCAKYVEPKPNEHIRYLCARGQIWYALGRNLLAADRIEEAVRAFDHAIQDQWSKQFISEQFSSELHIEMAEVAMLMFSLPEVHQTQSPAAEYAAKARAFADSAGSGQRFLGLLKLPSAVAQFRNGEYRDAERSLLQAQQFEGGDGNLNWLNLAMTVARLDRRQEAREWWARATESFVQGSTPPTTPLTMSEKLLFHNAEQFFGEGVAGSSQPSQ